MHHRFSAFAQNEMAAKLSQPQRFEVPPFELVKLVHPPAFSAVASSLSPNYAAAGHAFGGPSSPPASSTQPINLGNVGSPPPLSSLSGRLSQLVNPRLADQRRSSWASSDSGHVAGPAIATPPPAGHDAGTPSSSKQVIRTAEAGNDTIYLAGSEGGLAVWKLDPSRTASDKGKQKAVGIQGEDVVSDNAEEVGSFFLCTRNGLEQRLIEYRWTKCLRLHIYWTSTISCPASGPLRSWLFWRP